ncbi:hypothetical protein [Deinococcus soli (ex Cha et al. 2016)]|jgi:hypothetical protein|uniref:Uncharacterized protein n=1 Tax=Deinococcus soli (ex Cha et al. 2016) TaxID=1309411 RepID=A0ACC6KNP2_9DEIO|nr:hypothetical protein [Deinococcus soli (ex Cha et al. 2016)]MDR6330663.1 hypothetical protein [Deinococcus soli (ex Cha et al. 2016)]MDR6754030.1 hypothetical protein [Deinococcus soli (ex Cha et al. 2016)]
MTAMNVNDRVRVRLAPHGLTVLAEYHDRLRDQLPVSMRGLLRPTVADADGLHTFLLWELLAIFGASSGHGFPDVFEGGALHLVPWDAPTPAGTTVRDTTTGATATYVAHATHVAGRGPAQPAALLHVDGHHFTVDAEHFARHFVAVVP